MDLPGQFQYPLCGGGLACINMREDADISVIR
jgi:hypothetical protein